MRRTAVTREPRWERWSARRSRLPRGLLILFCALSVQCGGGTNGDPGSALPRPPTSPGESGGSEGVSPAPDAGATTSTVRGATSTSRARADTSGGGSPRSTTTATGATTTRPASDRSKTPWEVDPVGPRGPVLPWLSGCEDIVVIRPDGTSPQRLDPAAKSFGDTEPSWDPSGKKLAFVRAHEQGDDIYVMTADGRDVARLTAAGGDEPSWSADGRRIAFVRRHDRTPHLYSMNADGGNERRLVDRPGYSPAWSPDGARIAFVAVPEGESSPEIHVVELSSGRVSRLTNNQEFSAMDPAWSPDGTRIALSVANSRTGNSEIYVMGVDGANVRRLTREPTLETHPTWSPDSKKIVFTSAFEVATVDLATGGLVRLVDTDGSDADPAWSPDGSRIAYASHSNESC